MTERYTREEGRFGSFIADNVTGEVLDLYDILKILNAAPFSAAELQLAKRFVMAAGAIGRLVNSDRLPEEADFDYWQAIRNGLCRNIPSKPDCGNNERMLMALLASDWDATWLQIDNDDQALDVLLHLEEDAMDDQLRHDLCRLEVPVGKVKADALNIKAAAEQLGQSPVF